jgi:hypothetical protein
MTGLGGAGKFHQRDEGLAEGNAFHTAGHAREGGQRLPRRLGWQAQRTHCGGKGKQRAAYGQGTVAEGTKLNL